MQSKSAARGAAGLAFAGLLCLTGCQQPASNTAPQAAANSATNVAATNAPAPAVSDAADAADVTSFLQGLYDHYKTSKNNTFQMFDANAKEVWDADFIKLMAVDEKGLKGDVGVIDGDWLCACQDFESLKATVAVQSASPTAATASSDFVDVGIPGDGGHHVNFKLVKENGHWRLDDIQDPGEDWLRAQLQAEIKAQSAPGAKKTAGDEAP